jgi:hypothetical protein
VRRRGMFGRKNGFYFVYNVLETYYQEHKEEDNDLGNMLSDWDPEIWVPLENEDFTTADPAVKQDWIETWNGVVGENKQGSSEQVFMIAKKILDYYTNDVEYDLGDAVGYLKEQLNLQQ